MRSQFQPIMGGVGGRSRIDDNEWHYLADPDENPEFFEHMTEPVQIQFLGKNWDEGPWIMPNKFPPNAKADRHAHNHATIYYITKGSMTFNDGSGWYHPGDLRWIEPYNEYGPEEAGPDGVEFLLISAGPIDVQWEGGDTHIVKG
ncbi:hypothetical protein PSU4_05440 [Pseudonocardia sulfidoxydans NBRC 16205]|jgi:hypothetical protein|uniref:AraC-type arabinose-binding/dimerisation domain-containing protein n=1 Tax=Pseudonocardia sulfidoxydans NBRC 16205 TaxID=1223511 RepID=A0A511D9V4_9PSEU|nr:AraC family ligand binding domain-containing protein [Pseudonocardia sulfidoxydans]RTL67614.1 MAG: hypothetical protein EKK42_12350 [Pseudonocardiaceae bacterium]GEL21590.1 hypothetical protein PSU4_05440 [Pseudonocardia sulfidoxydans NBRC 16205]